MDDGILFKVEVIDNDSNWEYKVKINNAKKSATNGSGFNSYDSAVEDAEYFVMSYVKENKCNRWAIRIDPDPRMVALAEQEALAQQEALIQQEALAAEEDAVDE